MEYLLMCGPMALMPLTNTSMMNNMKNSWYGGEMMMYGMNMCMMGWKLLTTSELGLSLMLMCLTTGMYMMLWLMNEKGSKLWHMIYVLLVWMFKTGDILEFYMCFELLLMPLYSMMMNLGSQYKSYEASWKLFVFTFMGSITLMMGLIYNINKESTTNMELLEYYKMSEEWFMLYMMPFLVKLPIYPFYNWLCWAHSEASTSGSVLLASMMLKLSIYGMYKINLSLFSKQMYMYWTPLLVVLALLSMVYAISDMMKESDMKKMMAMSSIMHMNLSLFAVLQCNYYGTFAFLGSIFTHAFMSSGLFMVVGGLYQSFKTSNKLELKYLSNVMPLMNFILLILLLGNISFPMYTTFMMEVYSLSAAWYNYYYLTIGLTCMLLYLGAYYLYLFNLVSYGYQSKTKEYKDLTLYEAMSLFTLLMLSIISFFFKMVMSSFTLFSL